MSAALSLADEVCSDARRLAREISDDVMAGEREIADAIQRGFKMRERPLLEALELIQGFNWQLDDSDHGKEIKRRALEAIAKAKE